MLKDSPGPVLWEGHDFSRAVKGLFTQTRVSA